MSGHIQVPVSPPTVYTSNVTVNATTTSSPSIDDEDAHENGSIYARHPTAMDYDPAFLSAERVGRPKRRYGKCCLPLWTIQLLLVLAIVGMIVGPSFTLYIFSVRKAVDVSVQSLLKLTVMNAHSEINRLLINNRRVALNFGLRPSTISVINAARAGTIDLQDQLGGDWLDELGRTLVDNPDISTVYCVVNIGPTNNSSPNRNIMFSMDRWWLRDWGGTGNLTELETQLGWPAFFTWDWMNANNDNYEFHNATDHRGIPLTPAQKDILMSGYDAHNNTKPGTPHFVQWLTVISDYWVWFPFDSRPGSTTERGGWGKGRYNSTIDETYAYMQGSNPAPEGHEFWSYSPIGDTIQGYVGVNIYSNPLTPTIPSHLCQAGGAFKNSLDPYLRQSVPSENGIVLLIDSAKMNRDKTYHPGYIIATSVVGANTDGLRPYNDTMFGLDTSPSPTVREVGSILRSRYPSLNMTGLQTFSAPVPSTAQQWHIATLSLNPDRANHTWQIVVAFPHSDYFSTIDKSIRDAVLIIVVLTVVALVAITAMSVAVTVPLSGIAKRMDEVTSMKFSSIESGVLDRRSYVREIASLENTFQIMVQAFAAAIRKNADLIGTQRRGNMRR